MEKDELPVNIIIVIVTLVDFFFVILFLAIYFSISYYYETFYSIIIHYFLILTGQIRLAPVDRACRALLPRAEISETILHRSGDDVPPVLHMLAPSPRSGKFEKGRPPSQPRKNREKSWGDKNFDQGSVSLLICVGLISTLKKEKHANFNAKQEVTSDKIHQLEPYHVEFS